MTSHKTGARCYGDRTRCYRSAGNDFNNFPATNAFVWSDGSVYWGFSTSVTTYCSLNVRLFPFDTQNCDIVFSSWSFYGWQVDLFFNESFPNYVDIKNENQVDERARLLISLPLGGVRSIVTIVSVCLSVCLSIRRILQLNRTSEFSDILSTHTAVSRFASGCVAIRYVLPVLWMTSCLSLIHISEPTRPY